MSLHTDASKQLGLLEEWSRSHAYRGTAEAVTHNIRKCYSSLDDLGLFENRKINY